MAINTRKSTPGKTLIGFVALVGIAAALNVRDHIFRDANEEWYYPTALGDDDLFPALSPMVEGAPILNFEGEPLLLREDRLVAKKDWGMLKVGRDDTDRYFVYRILETGSPEGGPPEDVFFIKTEEGTGAESRYLVAVRSTGVPADSKAN